MIIRPTILVDTREQFPLTFCNLPSEPATLDTGDYSVRGLTHLVAVERKSLSDLLAVVGRDRDRFKRELQRLRGYRFRMLVVEANAEELERGEWQSQLLPAHVVGSLAAWVAQYELPCWLAGTHEAAGRFVERYLYQCARTIALEVEAVSAFVGDAMRPAEGKPRRKAAAAMPEPIEVLP